MFFILFRSIFVPIRRQRLEHYLGFYQKLLWKISAI